VIWEAFKPESEPRRAARRSDAAPTAATTTTAVKKAEAPRDSDFLQRQGGIY
jgi:penicillin-binding protein 1A